MLATVGIAIEELIISRMYDPPQPGEILSEDNLPALGLTIKEATAVAKDINKVASRHV
jgi:plasmid maintenance system antidote protein VapI